MGACAGDGVVDYHLWAWEGSVVGDGKGRGSHA